MTDLKFSPDYAFEKRLKALEDRVNGADVKHKGHQKISELVKSVIHDVSEIMEIIEEEQKQQQGLYNREYMERNQK